VSTTNFTFVVRRPDNGRVSLSAMVPDAARYVACYGELLHPGERITLSEFAVRIKAAQGCKAESFDFVPNKADRDAFSLTLWEELVKYTEDSVVNFNALPVEFFIDYEDVEYGFDADDCALELGSAAVDYFQNEVVAM